jgi:hypothetical protein
MLRLTPGKEKKSREEANKKQGSKNGEVETEK